MAFPLTNVPNLVDNARLQFDSVRWIHSDGNAGTLPKVLRVGRVTNDDPDIEIVKTCWDFKDLEATPDPVAWIGSAAPTDSGLPNYFGGCTSTDDHDEVTGIDHDPPSGLFDNTVIQSMTILGLKPMIDAARAAGEDTLWVVLFFDRLQPEVGEDGRTQLNVHWLGGAENIKLIVEGVP